MASVDDPATGPIKLAPSDLTFLWEECRRCFWMKVRGGQKRPSGPFPKIFKRLDRQTKAFFHGRRTEELAIAIRPGRVILNDCRVRSMPLEVPGHLPPVMLGGSIDTIIEFDDQSYGIVDYKTSGPKEGHVANYARQLHAYALAAENPSPGSVTIRPITQLGLLVVEPTSMVSVKEGVAYVGIPRWVEIERGDEAFMLFLSEVLDILELTSPPEPNPSCQFCAFVRDGLLSALAEIEVSSR